MADAATANTGYRLRSGSTAGTGVNMSGRPTEPGSAPSGSSAGRPQPGRPQGEPGAGTPVRRRLHPAQRQLLVAAAGVIIGSFLPWVTVNAGLSLGGFAGAGLYTFYLGIFGIAGGLVPRRRLAIGQGAVLAVGAVALPVWQLVHLTTRVGFSGWLPGAGLIMVLASGLLAALSTWQLVRD